MAVAFDAVTSSGLQTTDFSFNHTPAGTPRGVIIGVGQTADADEVDSTTYGGSATSGVTGSPASGTGGEAGTVHVDFLGTSVPTGVQSVAVNETGGGNKAAFALTVTADADVVVQDTTVVHGQSVSSGDNEIGTLSLGGNTCLCGVLIWSGANGVAGLSPQTGWTDRGEVDLGIEVCVLYTYDTVGTSDVPFGFFTTNVFDYSAIAFALTEGGGATTHTASGSLASGAAVIDGAAIRAAIASGAVAAQLASIVGEASRIAEAQGAMQAQASTVVGAATVEGTSASASGALQAGPSVVDGSATRVFSASGSLESQAAAVAGVAGTTIATASGALQSGPAVIDGAATKAIGASGALRSGAATIAGAAARGTIGAVGVLKSGAALVRGLILRKWYSQTSPGETWTSSGSGSSETWYDDTPGPGETWQ